ncbi:MAG: hypothetical protein HZB61_10255 [Nitrospirae bacterium]|nr:hypothetical protein [Nitrospirota bacterium]
MYRKSDKYSRKLKAAREAKERKRLESPAPDYPPILPELRREMTIVDHDFGDVTHEIKLYRTDRIDCYDMHVDGNPYKKRVGWSRVLELIRKNLPRVRSI